MLQMQCACCLSFEFLCKVQVGYKDEERIFCDARIRNSEAKEDPILFEIDFENRKKDLPPSPVIKQTMMNK